MKTLSYVLLSGAFFFAGCKEETTFQKDQLTGHWAVYAAERDGRETTLLNGAVFQFMENGTMQTNVTGVENSGAFELQGKEIMFRGGENMVFEIGMLAGDTLLLNTQLEGMRFVLDLHRTTTEAQ
jgi:hypothetical protein